MLGPRAVWSGLGLGSLFPGYHSGFLSTGSCVLPLLCPTGIFPPLCLFPQVRLRLTGSSSFENTLLDLFLKDFIYLFIDRGKGRERDTNVWLSLTHPLLGIWPATQACALTGNWTSNPLVRRPVLNPQSHNNQGLIRHLLDHYILCSFNLLCSLFLFFFAVCGVLMFTFHFPVLF